MDTESGGPGLTKNVGALAHVRPLRRLSNEDRGGARKGPGSAATERDGGRGRRRRVRAECQGSWELFGAVGGAGQTMAGCAVRER